jgi:hypothetical protein
VDGFFSIKTFLRLLAGAMVLAAAIILLTERIENSRPSEISAKVEVTRLVERTVVITQIVERVITSIPAVSREPEATHTATIPVQPSSTSTPETLAVLPQGVAAWCVPHSTSPENTIPVTGSAPENAVSAEWVDGMLTVITQVESCTFTVAFNKPFPDGIHLQVQDLGPKPFVDVVLTPMQGDPTQGYVELEHPFLVDPPFWQVTYMLSIAEGDSTVLWTQPVLFRRSSLPLPCPEGGYPDPVTMQCPLLAGE